MQFFVLCVRIAERMNWMSESDRFIEQNQHKIINIKLGNYRKGLPVGKHLVLTSGFYIYNRHQRQPIIDVPFKSIIDAHKFATWMIGHYGKSIFGDDLMPLLRDESYAEAFFKITQYSVDDGEYFHIWVESRKNIITSPEVAWITS